MSFRLLWSAGPAFRAVQVDVGASSTPAFVDLDGDGDPDLVVGNGQGVLTVFENDAGTLVEVSAASSPFHLIAAIPTSCGEPAARRER